MLLSLDYTYLRTAVLTRDVIEKLRQKYPTMNKGWEPVEITRDYIKSLNEEVRSLLPGKEDLVTEWILKCWNKDGLDYSSTGVDKFVERADFFFKNNKEPDFQKMVLEMSSGRTEPMYYKNLLSFTPYDLVMVKEELDKERKLAGYNKFPGDIPRGVELIYEDNKYKILKATKAEAVCELGIGSEWCTKDEIVADDYLNRGPMYLIYESGKRIAQLHIDAVDELKVELNDVKNRRMTPNKDMRELLIRSRLIDSILNIIDLDEINSEGLFIKFVDGTDNPRVRELCAKEPNLAYLYSIVTLKGNRFPEGEKVLSRGGYIAVKYTYEVLESRFLAAEQNLYNQGCGKDYFKALYSVDEEQALEYFKQFFAKDYELEDFLPTEY